MIVKVGEAIKAFAKFNRCEEIVIKKSNDKVMAQKNLDCTKMKGLGKLSTTDN